MAFSATAAVVRLQRRNGNADSDAASNLDAVAAALYSSAVSCNAAVAASPFEKVQRVHGVRAGCTKRIVLRLR